ncbi:MAG: tRNA guanosine(34) transglycosylase Tgt [Patescibacteria group bacterium]
MFKLIKKSKKSRARLGRLKTAHGEIVTPFFMPIATKGAVKNLAAADLRQLGAQIILSNTYHLYLTPGLKVIKRAGGLHKFMDWDGPILTDSGGFQVFSLAKIRKILSQGVEFRSHLDGSKHLFTPKKVLAIQKIIGSDIAMIFDICPPATAKRPEILKAVKLTSEWAKQAARAIGTAPKSRSFVKQLFFCIIQGGVYADLRKESLEELVALEDKNFSWDGYAIGGLAVGESNQEMYRVLDDLIFQMPADRPRYLMGVGTPENIIEAVMRGVDMFDCVIPTREARHGRLYISKLSLQAETRRHSEVIPRDRHGRLRSLAMTFNKGFYETINILNSRYKTDLSPINDTNLKNYSKAYLHHLFKTNEPLAMRLATLNNLNFYLSLMLKIRQKIKSGQL